MKRSIALCLCAGVLAFTFAGCGEKTEVKTQKTTTTPGGTTQQTTTQEIKKTGDNPPATP